MNVLLLLDDGWSADRIRAAEREDRLAAYVEALSAALGHADRGRPFENYRVGL